MTLAVDFQIIYVLVLLITGMAVGFASGLLGVGGGFIMVPVQIWSLTSMGIDPTIATRVALGTSLAVILPTALSGCRGHACRGAVLWRTGVALGLCGLLGAFLGGTIAAHAPANFLQKFFGLVVLAGALAMLFSGRISLKGFDSPRGESKESISRQVLLGSTVGFVSGLSGIGGGVILVPATVMTMGITMHQAVGTSSIAIAIISIASILSYALNGQGVAGLPPYSFGYINILQLALLAGTSIPMAQAGVRLAHRLPAKKLTYIFTALMLYVSLMMLGVFGWLRLAFNL